jgi:hypothetical protein
MHLAQDRDSGGSFEYGNERSVFHKSQGIS